MALLHHRIGDLETKSQAQARHDKLPHRIGDLEITLVTDLS